MTVREFVGNEQLEEAERATRVFPDLLQINTLIRNEISQRMPVTAIRVLAFEFPTTIIWAIAGRNQFGK